METPSEEPQPVKTAREVLIEEYLRQHFDGSEPDLDFYLEFHRQQNLNPYTTCADFTCTRAREYADAALTALEAGGYYPIRHATATRLMSDSASWHLARRMREPRRHNDS